MRDEVFWAVVWGIICLAIVTIINLISSYYKNQDQIVADMVAGGTDPIGAVCSMSDTYGRNPTCIIYALKNQE